MFLYPLRFVLERSTLNVFYRRVGIETPADTPDRDYLEKRIFPYLVSLNVRNILFAGVGEYTWHYYKFFPRTNFFTIDYDSQKKYFGQKGTHTIGSVCELEKYYDLNQFEVVLYNGLIGYGLNTAVDVDKAIDEAYQVLSNRGILIIGWNNTNNHLNFKLEDLPSYNRFTKLVPVELGLKYTNRHVANSENRHTFDYLLKE